MSATAFVPHLTNKDKSREDATYPIVERAR